MTALKEKISDTVTSDVTVTELTSRILDLPPSCIEFIAGSRNKESCHFIVGTYNLQQIDEGQIDISGQQTRNGSLQLYKLNNGHTELVEAISYPSAILDLHFYLDTNIFAVASSTGSVSVFKAIKEQDNYSIQHVATHQILPVDILVLSLAWYPHTNKLRLSEDPLFAITASNGCVHMIRLSADLKCFRIVNELPALILHSDNAWTCTISDQYIYSGGDDSILSRIKFDRVSLEDKGKITLMDNSGQQWNSTTDHRTSQIDYKGHGAGVTAIIALPTCTVEKKNKILLTGSYDDFIRVYEILDNQPHKLNCYRILTELFVGGGVWRLKAMKTSWHEIEECNVDCTVLASCMHAGAKILKIRGYKNGEWKIDLMAEMTAHQSMCYASDFLPQSISNEQGLEVSTDDNVNEWTIVSTSFYDKLLQVWKWTPESSSES
ncbi:BgTH12-02613 [Blumeria graminis f. sp. triticale]|uniref:methylated diphthine methylhydrolase n=3 Tax=Blumeria graminis TaxID=34373 RepID=A0A9X9QDF3_BLUGR|nr:hypothetical protein BGT96224_A20090 [Blumeria graminis f. sp. tritici 96224]CAD6502939.1 BgTH12-02613 [Blumeria graminis f. sp. triticale]VDB88799.1 BgtA-20090 [Blumeria graminis f. sp. tritici]